MRQSKRKHEGVEMIDDERLQKSVELMQDATMVICSDDQAVAMLAAIMMTTSMAKEQKFPALCSKRTKVG